MKILFHLLLLSSLSLHASELRTWTFATNGVSSGPARFSFRRGGAVDAIFVKFAGTNEVIIRRLPDALECRIRVSDLSNRDIVYLEQFERDGAPTQARLAELEELKAQAQASQLKAIQSAEKQAASEREALEKIKTAQDTQGQLISDQLALVRRWRWGLERVAGSGEWVQEVVGYLGVMPPQWAEGPYAQGACEILRLDALITERMMRDDKSGAGEAARDLAPRIQKFLDAGVLK